MADGTNEVGALKAEALARDKWRGGDTELKPEDTPGHTLPASGAGTSGDQANQRSGAGGPAPLSGTMVPPD